MAIQILVIDDHPLFRDGLRAVLGSDPSLTVVGDAADCRAGAVAAETMQPELVILDVGLPGTSGIVAIDEIRRAAPRSKILMLTMHSSHEYVLQALAAGAHGYALKDQPPLEIVEAVRVVAGGGRYLAPRLPRTLLDVRSGTLRGSVLDVLSPREREIFDLVARGFSSQGIAGQLFISIKTVETHRAHINRKLGFHSTGDLIRFAARHQLIA
jgi:DNA-binding NarL/FixJ family response regulator